MMNTISQFSTKMGCTVLAWPCPTCPTLIPAPIWKQEMHAFMCAEVLNSFDCQAEKGHTP